MSSLAAAELRAALCEAEARIDSARVPAGARAAARRRLAAVRDVARPELARAFTPSSAARREAVIGAGRGQWEEEAAAWREQRSPQAGAGRAPSPESLRSELTGRHARTPGVPGTRVPSARLPRLELGRAAGAGAAAVPARDAGGAEPWQHLFGDASAPVNEVARIQAPRGRTLLERPAPGSAPSTAAPLPFDTLVMVVRRTTQATAAERWCYVTAPEVGAAGFCEERYLAIGPPEPGARLHRVAAGQTLGSIATAAYGAHMTAEGNARLYMQALYEANKDRASVKLAPVQLSLRDTWHRREAEEETLRVYRRVQVLEGMSLWIPSNDFVQRLAAAGAVTSGSSELTKAWRAASEVVDDAIEAAKYGAGFVVGSLEGAWSAIVDLFQGAAEMISAVAEALYHLVTRDPGRIKGMLMKWVDQMRSAWERRGAIADEFLKRWNAPSGWDRGRFQGEVLGWVMMTVLILLATAGAGAAASAGSLGARYPQVAQLLRTVDTVSDVTTYLGGALRGIQAAGSLPEAARTIVQRRLPRALAPRAGAGAAHIHEEVFSANRTYESSPKHTGRDRRVGDRKVAKEPTDGTAALAFSFRVSPSSSRRIGIDVKDGEFVVFDRTGNKVKDKQVVGGVYHGHVRAWDDLEDDMQKILIEHGVVDKGRIKIDPSRWDLQP